MLTSVTEQADSLERNANDAIIQSRKLDNISVIETQGSFTSSRVQVTKKRYKR